MSPILSATGQGVQNDPPTLEQLLALAAVERHKGNISKAASDVGVSQSGLSRRVQSLERCVGTEVLARRGRHILGLTEAGKLLVEHAKCIQSEIDAISALRLHKSHERGDILAIATTQTLAAYALPKRIEKFLSEHKGSQCRIAQGEPARLAQLVRSGEVDCALATDAFHLYDGLRLAFTHKWRRSLIAQPDHVVFDQPIETVADIARHPLITYDFGMAQGGEIAEAFSLAHSRPQVVVAATDAEVIKAYARTGVGVGLIASMAMDPQRDKDLYQIDVTDLIGPGRVAAVINPGSENSAGSSVGPLVKAFLHDFSSDLGTDFFDFHPLARHRKQTDESVALQWL